MVARADSRSVRRSRDPNGDLPVWGHECAFAGVMTDAGFRGRWPHARRHLIVSGEHGASWEYWSRPDFVAVIRFHTTHIDWPLPAGTSRDRGETSQGHLRRLGKRHRHLGLGRQIRARGSWEEISPRLPRTDDCVWTPALLSSGEKEQEQEHVAGVEGLSWDGLRCEAQDAWGFAGAVLVLEGQSRCKSRRGLVSWRFGDLI